MKPLALCFVALGAAATAAPALADLDVRFVEGAPKDRFSVTNTGACPLGPVALVIDLDGSAGRLIFDTTASGAGVQVFQPFALVAGAGLVEGLPQVSDGDTRIALQLSELAAGDTVAFTIDVDDTIGRREITVDGSEIAGAGVTLTGAATASATFGSSARATLATPACTS